MAQNICICPKCKIWVADGTTKCPTCGSTLLTTHYTDLFFLKLSPEEQSKRISEYIEKDGTEWSKGSSGSVGISQNSAFGQSNNGYAGLGGNVFARSKDSSGSVETSRNSTLGQSGNGYVVSGENGFARTLRVLGKIFIIIGVLGFLVGLEYESTFEIPLIYLLSGVISGIFTMAFGEVINLLHSINKKLDRLINL